MIFGAILAGGVGSRMGNSELPKQFLQLGRKPIIIHTIEKFLLNPKFEKIYIGINENWSLYMSDLLEKYIEDRDNIIIVSGGKDRNETIMNILKEIQGKYGENEEDVIVTHDAVRPFVTSRIIEENINMVITKGSCNTVIPSIDTIVTSKDGNLITDIPNRAYMYQGQTPQSFKINLLKKLFESLSQEEKDVLTDACKIYIFKKYPVYLINGEISNLKITTPTDYEIAQAMLGGKK